MALSTSFVTGWFFYGQFFDHAVGGPFTELPPIRARTAEDLARSRGRFHLPATPAELVEMVAERFIDSDDAQEMVNALYREVASRYIDWDQQYANDLLKAHKRLRADRARVERQKQKAVDAWMERRRKSARVH